ncbi:MAG: amidohydrolase family protein [Ginsengibacter sp.]
MKNKIINLLFTCFISLSSFCQTYITNVTLIDVEKRKLIPEQTVTVSGDIISKIQSSKNIKTPANAVVIDGRGKFLMPGFTDAHVHFFQSGGLYTRPDGLDFRKHKPYEKEIEWVHKNMEDFLRRYVQAGITSVIDVGATFSFLQQRDSFANKSYAPSIYMTGPLLTSYEPPVFKDLKNDEPFILVKTPEDGIKGVQQELPYHPDFIKVWYIINGTDKEAAAKNFVPVIKAIIDEAHKNNLKVAVHATERITAQLAVENGCDYLVHEVEDEIVKDDFLKLLKDKKIILCPTLIVADGYSNTFGQKNNFSLHDLTKSNPEQIGSLTDLKHLPDTAMINSMRKRNSSPRAINYFNHVDSIRMINLKKMTDAGITIAAGTDAGNIGTQHASSFLSELQAMKRSGLTNWQIIQSATINGAKVLSKEKIFGSIAVGKKADMILLNANPLDSIENITAINLVVNKGHVINPDTLIKETPLALVLRQLNAYNERNIEAFVEPYADDVEMYYFPDKLIGKGKDNMRKQYSQIFNKFPELHCEIKERIIQGNIIIDKESVSGINKTAIEGTSIYQIENNKIKKVYVML